MRLMTLNVLLGGEDRFGALCAIAAAARPDVLVLQECVGWEDGARPRAMAEAIGAPADDDHVLLGRANPRPSGLRYDVCVLSRTPFGERRVHPLTHCAVEVTVGPLRLVGAHLASRDEDTRLAELAALMRPGAVIAGDLNALSRHDPYPADLDARLRAAGIDKYGHPPRFDVTDRLFAAGWVDALRGRPRWVTAVRNGLGTRTDYVLVPGEGVEVVDADVLDVGAASDHHAVVADLRGT
jgi:exodeoxyribonuclease-3